MLGRLLKAGIIVIAVLMLATLPAGRLHQSANHFRSAMLRRTMVRYVTVAQPCPTKSSEIATARTRLIAHLQMLTDAAPRPYVASVVAEPVSRNRMLMRFKLGHSSSQFFDPLL